ncbi:M48 family metallopeptidase [Oryzibacter oryziterrae]|uniref:M48 family metallopeptidase n=1 Tax=Oryzibacter oryziterrae TaxID=2766474 RepID=UPI001F3A44B3|nr:SprT family zinc-dependent metalloprotease [Oryzibacter oryziterrae]
MTIRLPFLFAPPKPRPSVSGFALAIDGREVPVTVRRNARARRYTLRVTTDGSGATVTIPKRGTIAEARAFAERHRDWIAARIGTPQQADAAVPQSLLYRGEICRVAPTGAARGVVRLDRDADGAVLHVSGAPEHLRRRLVDHLRKSARLDLEAAVARHAASLGVSPSAIRLKDTTSRWGSASARGALAFSWRLVMAPPFVLDYVAAHEVAHLREMNHSDRFWVLCRQLAPRTEEAKAWLKAHGRELHRAV